MGSSLDEMAHPVGLQRLPLRTRDSHTTQTTPKPAANHPNGHFVSREKQTPGGRFQHRPESLNLLSSNRIRSPTESSMSTLSSVPDSASHTGSLSTVASPLSSSYTSDFNDFFPSKSRPASRILHRHQPSNTTCSTFVNEDDDGQSIAGYSEFNDNLKRLQIVHDISMRPDEIHPGANDGEDTLPVSPSTEGPPIKQEDKDLERRMTFYKESPCQTPEPPCQPAAVPTEEKLEDAWDTQSSISDDEEVDSILDYTLQVTYGVDLNDASVPQTESRRVARRFMRELGQTMWHTGPDNQSHNAMSTSASSSSTPGGNSGTGESQRGGKRKKQPGKGGDEEGDDLSDGDESSLPIKRPRPNPRDEENLRLSCPFRKRNPQRFNVRDHHSCAMTYFPKFAELRQHIVKQHKRDNPTAFVCDRCNRDFTSRKDLRDHQRLPRDQMCDISDHDPESGIDGPTSTKLLSRKRASGTSPEVQWREVWNILFPDDEDHDVPTYQFIPVIEHFEMANSYLSSFDFLRTSLADKFSNPATLETLATKFHQCFVEAMERCVAEAQNMPYANRSNKRSEQLAAATTTTTQPRKAKDVLPRPDSGVVMTDDGSDESGSVMGGGLVHKESVRTVRGPYRGSGLSSTSNIAPAQTSSQIFDPSTFGMPPATTSTPMTGSVAMAPADVHAWTHGVMYPLQGVPADFGVQPSDLQMQPHHHQPDLAWQSFYNPHAGTNGVEDDLSGFL